LIADSPAKTLYRNHGLDGMNEIFNEMNTFQKVGVTVSNNYD
jgi:hypothetical protein